MHLRTPYAVVTAVERPRPTTKRELVRLSRQLELAAIARPPQTIAATLTKSATANPMPATAPVNFDPRLTSSMSCSFVTG